MPKRKSASSKSEMDVALGVLAGSFGKKDALLSSGKILALQRMLSAKEKKLLANLLVVAKAELGPDNADRAYEWVALFVLKGMCPEDQRMLRDSLAALSQS
jgi:hypothetical protein